MTTQNTHLLPFVWPHPRLREAWESGEQTQDGATQPWIQALLYQLCRALDVRRAVEFGCWRGYTSAWLACAIAHNGGGVLTVIDSNTGCIEKTKRRVAALELLSVEVLPLVGTTEACLTTLGPTQFAFLDDDKLLTAQHLATLSVKAPGCYVALHDVELPHVGAALRAVGGIILDIPAGDGTGSLGLVRL